MSQAPAPEKHFEAIAQCARDGIVTITADLTIQYANPAMGEMFGLEPDDLVGRSFADVLEPERARELEHAIGRYDHTGEQAGDWDGMWLQGRHRDGWSIPLGVSLTDFEQDGRQYFCGIVRDVTDRVRRENQLTGLNRLAQGLADAETADEICEQVIDAARAIIDHRIAAVALYDEDEGRLEPRAWTEEAEGVVEGLFGTDRGLPWEAFVAQEERTGDDLAEAGLEAGGTQLRSAMVHPIGTYGVFLAGATDPGAFDGEDADITRILVGNAYSALERLDRERALRERTDQLAEKTASLERLRRINAVIRELTTVLTEATGREEITSEVCSRLAESDPYRFVWFGSFDRTCEQITPEAAAGDGREYLEAITVTVSESEPDPVGEAVRTRSTRLYNDLYRDPPFEPWRQEAIQRGFRAMIAVPVVHRGAVYGVLSLYTGEAEAFDQLEVSVLQELGETVGYALNAAERKQAFTSERSVELEFDVGGYGETILAVVGEVAERFELENLVERGDGSTTAFFTVRGAGPDEVIEWANGREDVRRIECLTERDDEHLFGCTLAESTVWTRLQRHGGVVREAVATPESARVVVRIRRSADPRSFEALLEEAFGSVELVARRERSEPVMTPEEFEAEFRDRLTDRQNEVLRTAYYAGFFAWPREIKSAELADVLGIAQPTVSRHIRSGEEAFLSMVYDE